MWCSQSTFQLWSQVLKIKLLHCLKFILFLSLSKKKKKLIKKSPPTAPGPSVPVSPLTHLLGFDLTEPLPPLGRQGSVMGGAVQRQVQWVNCHLVTRVNLEVICHLVAWVNQQVNCHLVARVNLEVICHLVTWVNQQVNCHLVARVTQQLAM